ncbi:reverse transcriptase domain-containing protein [Tanacetum coccineum]
MAARPKPHGPTWIGRATILRPTGRKPPGADTASKRISISKPREKPTRPIIQIILNNRWFMLRVTGPEPITPLNETTPNQNNTTTRAIIEGHLSALKEFLKDQSNHDLIKAMLIDFGDEIQDADDETEPTFLIGYNYQESRNGREEECPFTKRIIEFSSLGHRMPTNAKVYDGTGDPEDHQTLDDNAGAWFDKLPPGSIDNLGDLQEKFLNRFGMLKAYAKDPTEISKIIQKANETLSTFKERMSKRFSDNIPKTVDEMFKRVDDYVRSEEAFRNTELPKGEPDHRPAFRPQEHHAPYVPPQRPNHEFRRPIKNKVILTLDSLVSTPQEIMATEQQLRFPQPLPLVGVPSKENLNKYCEYHNEKGHSTNGCFYLKKQLEIALESGKLNHLVKDVRQRGKGGGGIVVHKKARTLSEEALVMEAEVEGYLVRRIHIDEGVSIKIMYEHCFNMLHSSIQARLGETRTMVSGFSREQVKPLGKIELRCLPSPYNIILGRPGLRKLRAIPSTIHGMMKFPTP